MTRKDYQLIANALKETKPPPKYIMAVRGWESTVYQIAVDLERANPRFNRAKFLQACGLEEK